MSWGIVLAALAALLAVATVLSFVSVAHGMVRVFSFPRLQILAVTLILLAVTLFLAEGGWLAMGTALCLVVVAIAQAVPIVQFTRLRKTQSMDHDGDPDGPDTLSILSFNIKQSNADYAGVRAVARQADADLAVFMETDARWVEELSPLRETYPHVVACPLENSYGMILFSRLPLDDVAVRELVMEGIPSITARVTLRDGQPFRLFCVHPEPPVPTSDSVGRDAELVAVAKLVRDETLPSIVTGDLNDVAWSHTTRLFQRISGLLDPRVGRGFYSTFDARYAFIRWPLDHLFHDARFRLISIRRMDAAGSDHFPINFRLALTPIDSAQSRPEGLDSDDRAEMRDIEQQGKRLDREPVGTDWEK